MENYVGLDVSQRIKHVCVIDAEAHITSRRMRTPAPKANGEALQAFARNALRIGLENGPLSI